jgi:hypothetical protein
MTKYSFNNDSTPAERRRILRETGHWAKLAQESHFEDKGPRIESEWNPFDREHMSK